MNDVRMWFDPACPWAWLTSRWLVEVEQLRPIKLGFRVMSLAVLNGHSAEEHPVRWGAVRVAAAAQQRLGVEVLGPLYTALGTHRHVMKESFGPELYGAALAEAGLPADLAAAADTDEFDDVLRASHKEGMDLVGPDVGTPTVAITTEEGRTFAFFGPVVSPRPTGEEAAKLWDGVLTVAGMPGFFELKRGRTEGPMIS
ncbi:MAG TPA: disulfide bond formation protein DsbA [Candidatus Limnocylindrales bacterium]|nr:disulfide bond formation protein DsbA [Candidatus Limnocylindrales bacterium]